MLKSHTAENRYDHFKPRLKRLQRSFYTWTQFCLLFLSPSRSFVIFFFPLPTGSCTNRTSITYWSVVIRPKPLAKVTLKLTWIRSTHFFSIATATCICFTSLVERGELDIHCGQIRHENEVLTLPPCRGGQSNPIETREAQPSRRDEREGNERTNVG